MRTTLDLDEDVLQALKEIAELRGQSAGRVASDLVRKALTPPAGRPRIRNGVPVWPSRPGRVITNALVQQILNEED